MALVGAIGLVVGLFAIPAGAEHEDPVLVQGNPHCDDIKVDAGELPAIDESDTFDKEHDGETVVVTVTRTGTFTFDWSSTHEIGTVYVKGGPNANGYFYNPPVTEDTGLTTPTNPNNDKPYGISHISFCLDEIEQPPPDPRGFFTITKNVDDGQDEEELDPFEFSIVCDDEGTFSEDEIFLGDGDSWSLSTDGGVTDGLPAGTTCTITETEPEGDWSTSWVVEIDGTEEDSGDTLEAEIELVDGEDIHVIFTNSREGDAPPLPPVIVVVEETTTTVPPTTTTVPPTTTTEPPEVGAEVVVPEEEVEEEVAGVEVARELPRTGDALQTGTLLVFAGLALLLGGLALGFADRTAPAGRRI